MYCSLTCVLYHMDTIPFLSDDPPPTAEYLCDVQESSKREVTVILVSWLLDKGVKDFCYWPERGETNWVYGVVPKGLLTFLGFLGNAELVLGRDFRSSLNPGSTDKKVCGCFCNSQ